MIHGNAAFASFAYRRHADQTSAVPARHPVVIVGAGPVGLSLAIDLVQRGCPCVLLDDSDRIGEGSRAICFAKRTLEIFQGLGAAEPMLERGVEWKIGRVFQRDQELYRFDLLPEAGHRMPAFINLQQYHVEKALIDRALALGVDIRWLNQVRSVLPDPDGATVVIGTPDGTYRLRADHLAACDGARSLVRTNLGLHFAGEQFDDQFLIADVKMTAEFPIERWFWFDPPFHSGQSCLLHKQPDNIWRIDLQLSPDADAEHERKPEVVRPRIERMLGHADFELEWISIYRFQCRRLERFVHERVIFAGDAAHQVSPFGARGANSGVQDADNLGWKLAAVVAGEAPAMLLESYDLERSEAADENILNSTRATDFIAPRSAIERQFRNAALALAGKAPFARRFVNSGRLSLPTAYRRSPLSTPDREAWRGGPGPGLPVPDARLLRKDGTAGHLSDLLGHGFCLLQIGGADQKMDFQHTDVHHLGIDVTDDGWRDGFGEVATRFATEAGACYLLRPDRHVAARFKEFDAALIAAALDRALGRGPQA